MQKFRGKWQKLYIKDLIYGLLVLIYTSTSSMTRGTIATPATLSLTSQHWHSYWSRSRPMLDGHRSCTPDNSPPVTMPWSSSSSLHHHPVINFSENSLRQGPLIYYVYIPARVYRNFDKENFKNISLLKSLKRNFFEKKVCSSWVGLVTTNFPFIFSSWSSLLCLLYLDIKKYAKSYI